MPLIFWTKMNDIRLRPLAIFFGWTPAKNHSPKPVKLTALSDHPFFAPVFGRSKMVVRRLLDGVLPQTKHVHWGSLAIAGACHFVSLPCFSFLRWTLIRIKTKPTALVLLGWSNRFLPQNKFVTFSDFASFYLSVCTMLKTHSEARKTVLNFQRRFGCFIG
ncbi:hypothetical protein J4727_20295 [Providencia rettgeri]|uniref:Uncharacterized protein n=1 Tax=Providencia rettgeri TaxID=587 RepID=A0A939NHC1_PRORE|nr:hypothetical protein [Providencia rettgeri]